MPDSPHLRRFWQRLSSLDLAALLVALLFVVTWLARAAGYRVPLLLATLIQFFFLFFIAGYVLYRVANAFRGRLLWSLRNRLVVAYVFIALVPVLLLLALAGASATLVYRQLAAYLLYNDVQRKIEKLQALAESIAALPGSPPGGAANFEAQPSVSGALSAARISFPGLAVEHRLGPAVLTGAGGTMRRFAGMVQADDQVLLVAATRPSGAASPVLSLVVPLSADFADTLVPELGPLQFTITRPPNSADSVGNVRSIGPSNFVTLRAVETRGRFLPAARNFLDFEVKALTKFSVLLLDKDTVVLDKESSLPLNSTLFGTTDTRASILSRRLFSDPGDVGGLLAGYLALIGGIFLFLEIVALRAGVRLTRTITSAVDDLYRATQLVRSGDFSSRVQVQGGDQLAELGDSFNSMTGSISTLIEEQRQRQRLENEISIAREVQSQLFPRALPQMAGVELAAVCRAARMVSGDYYDFVQLGPQRIAMALADISGKGISAALLMASLQAAFRSQLLEEAVLNSSTAELVTRLNRHLYLNTSDDRYATLFFAVYDSSTRLLHYTNAGHLPPFLIPPRGIEVAASDKVPKLEEGGLVVGLFDDCSYAEGCVTVEPGSLLVAFSDGITEPENVYGEQFGWRRLAAEVVRHRHAPPDRLAELLIAAVEEWSSSAEEQADDMTVVVARLGG